MVAGKRLVVNEFLIDEQRAQDRETSGPTVDQAGVLANPAEPGKPGKIAFQDRRGVGR